MENVEPPALEENPTVAQIRSHSEQVATRAKDLTILHLVVDGDIFIRILNLDTTGNLGEDSRRFFLRNERTKQMQVLNLNEAESINDFMNKMMKVVNQIRLLGEKFPDSKIVDKLLVVLLERFESKISSLEKSKDLSKISLT